VSSGNWINIDKIILIGRSTRGGGYFIDLDNEDELHVSGEYAINIERLLLAACFGKLEIFRHFI